MQMANFMSQDDFINEYVNFNKKLIKSEETLPRRYRIADPAERMDLFRFWYGDKRDQEILQIQENQYKERRRSDGDAWFETGED